MQGSSGSCADMCRVHAGIPPRRSKDYVKQASPRNSQTGNPVYRVRTYSNSNNTELDNSEPLTGKQPGVLNVEAPSAVRLFSAGPHALPCITLTLPPAPSELDALLLSEDEQISSLTIWAP